MSAYCEITDVHADAFKVPASEVTTEHCVFDTFGNRHPVRRVTRLRGNQVKIVRDDGWPTILDADETITVASVTS